VFLGEYEHAGRQEPDDLAGEVPGGLADGGVVTRGMDGCLSVYTRDAWEACLRSAWGLDLFSREARQMSRFLFAAAADAEPDKQGRIMLPPALIKHAKLSREVIVAGVHDHVEIWDRATWRNHLDDVEGSAELVAERLAAKAD
jgi:MraZ protein